jgi:hypothetical protein
MLTPALAFAGLPRPVVLQRVLKFGARARAGRAAQGRATQFMALVCCALVRIGRSGALLACPLEER